MINLVVHYINVNLVLLPLQIVVFHRKRLSAPLCRHWQQTEELWAAMNVCPFAPEIDPQDRFLLAAPALTSLPRCVFCAIVSPNFPSVRKQKSHPQWGATFVFGADEQIRTAYLLITNEVLYRLSYISARNEHYSEASRSLQVLISEN